MMMKLLSRVVGAIPLVATSVLLSWGTPAFAITVSGTSILPNAVSYEYFGLNFADNIKTSNQVGTLDYSGQPGCGGICKATTTLGSDPSVYATVNEVVYQYTSGGYVQASLGYYLAYLNAPGTYAINLHALNSFSISDGVSAASTSLRLGMAGSDTSSFNNFTSTAFEEADCFNGCPSPGFAIPTAPFVPDVVVQMEANTLYFLRMDILIRAQPSGVSATAYIDPRFNDGSQGGTFLYSQGVTGSDPAAVPEPSTWLSLTGGFLLMGHRLRRNRRAGAVPFANA